MNRLPSSKILIKWALILASFLIVASILWNTNQFFRKFKNEERLKMEVLATAYENFNNADLDIDVSLEEKIIQSNKSIPMIITFENGDINRWANLDVENNMRFTALPVPSSPTSESPPATRGGSKSGSEARHDALPSRHPPELTDPQRRDA